MGVGVVAGTRAVCASNPAIMHIVLTRSLEESFNILKIFLMNSVNLTFNLIPSCGGAEGVMSSSLPIQHVIHGDYNAEERLAAAAWPRSMRAGHCAESYPTVKKP